MFVAQKDVGPSITQRMNGKILEINLKKSEFNAENCSVRIDTECNQDNNEIKRGINTQINDATTEDIEVKKAEEEQVLTSFEFIHHLTEE